MTDTHDDNVEWHIKNRIVGLGDWILMGWKLTASWRSLQSSIIGWIFFFLFSSNISSIFLRSVSSSSSRWLNCLAEAQSLAALALSASQTY